MCTDPIRELWQLEEVERDHILRVLEQTNWKVSGQKAAAEILGLNRSTLRPHTKIGYPPAISMWALLVLLREP